jgi:sugar-specific transcriptional regulator TrmB
MSDERVPREIAELLRERVESYEELETLVLFGRGAIESLTAARLADELGIPVPAALESLQRLEVVGLLERVAGAPDTFCAVLAERGLLARLAAVHRDDRIQLMTLMTNNALERLRTSALRAFSSAFLLRGKRDG